MDMRAIVESHAGKRIALIAESHLRLTGRELVPANGDIAEAMWRLPAAVLAHGTEDDPIFFYGNRRALELFEIGAGDFIHMPSRLSAEPLLREERAEFLTRVAAHGFIDDYTGIRISKTGKRFRIAQATVWTLMGQSGRRHGQAAAFSRWDPVD